MKKIFIVANIDPLKNSGGVEFVCKTVGLKLRDFYDVSIICRGNSRCEYDFEKIKVYQVKSSSLPIIGDFQYAFSVNKIIKKYKPDLLIDNGSLSFLTNNSCLKIISITHGTNYFNLKARDLTLKNFDKIVYRYFWSIIQRYHFKNIDYVISVSEKVSNELQSSFYKVQKEKIYVIDNGTFISEHNHNFSLYFNSGIFVSTDHVWKGINIIEKIAEKMPHITFKVCGNYYISKIKNIIYLGKLNQQELIENMNKSDFFIFPSIYEGQSLAILDAIASGLPVVISKESDPGIIKNGENGFIIENQSIEKYIHSINELYNNQELYKKIRYNNIELMKNYTWDRQSQKYLKFIQKILGK